MPPENYDPDLGFLVDIDLAAAAAIRFCDGLDWAAFLADDKTRSATIHQLLVIGEATKGLTPRFRDAHPDMPWDEMAGMRDRLIHGYNKVNFQIVWKTVQEHLPVLRRYIAPLLPKP